MTDTPFTNLRDLIADTAADLSNANPYWTAGCLADALIKKGVAYTHQSDTPVAWMYYAEDGQEATQPLKNRLVPNTMGWTETPLYTHPPATDVAAQDDTALLEKLADEACKRLGIDPNEIVDPVGPVRKKDDIIYAMYAFAREKFWDTEPNDVAALVEAAKASAEGWANAVEFNLLPVQHWQTANDLQRQLRQALVPFTEGQP